MRMWNKWNVECRQENGTWNVKYYALDVEYGMQEYRISRKDNEI